MSGRLGLASGLLESDLDDSAASLLLLLSGPRCSPAFLSSPRFSCYVVEPWKGGDLRPAPVAALKSPRSSKRRVCFATSSSLCSRLYEQHCCSFFLATPYWCQAFFSPSPSASTPSAVAPRTRDPGRRSDAEAARSILDKSQTQLCRDARLLKNQ